MPLRDGRTAPPISYEGTGIWRSSPGCFVQRTFFWSAVCRPVALLRQVGHG